MRRKIEMQKNFLPSSRCSTWVNNLQCKLCGCAEREREMIKKVLLLNKSIEFPSAIVNHLTISIKFVSLTMRAVIKKKTLSVHILIPLRSSDRKKLFMLQKL